MARVYLETSFISACVSTRDDPSSLARHATSLEWWSTQRPLHEVFTSAEVIGELDAAEWPGRTAALALAATLPAVALTPAVAALAGLLVRERVMPGPVQGDAVHVAAAVVHGMDYLLSWNVRHLANLRKLRHLHTVCAREGLRPPLIVVPDLLWEQPDE